MIVKLFLIIESRWSCKQCREDLFSSLHFDVSSDLLFKRFCYYRNMMRAVSPFKQKDTHTALIYLSILA